MEKKGNTIQIGDRTYDLKIGLRVIDIVESELNKSILSLWKETAEQTVKVSELWTVLWGCVNVQNPKMTRDKFLTELDLQDTKINDLMSLFLTMVTESYSVEEKKKGDSDSKN